MEHSAPLRLSVRSIMHSIDVPKPHRQILSGAILSGAICRMGVACHHSTGRSIFLCDRAASLLHCLILCCIAPSIAAAQAHSSGQI